MFWTDWGIVNPKLERADLTGENRKTVINFAAGWYYPMSVVIDYEVQRIYWMDAIQNYIYSVNFDGKNRRYLHYIEQNIYPSDPGHVW